MTHATKNPIALARLALKVGQEALPPYSHPKSQHKFTQPQLFALLVLRQFFKLDYRGLVQWLAQWSDLRQVLDLKTVPHYSTLCYAEERLLKKGPLTSCFARLSRPPAVKDCSARPVPRRPSIPRA